MQRAGIHKSIVAVCAAIPLLVVFSAALILFALQLSHGAQAQQGAPRSDDRRDSAVAATSLQVQGDERRTRLTVLLDQAVPFATYALADPYRIVVDLPRVNFRLPAQTQTSSGLIVGLRRGTVAPDIARIILETKGPVRIDAANVRTPPGRRQAQLQIDLVGTDAANYRVVPPPEAAKMATIGPSLPAALRPRPAGQRPGAPNASNAVVIVLDPGHGGVDPGARAGEFQEKDVVLAVARHLEKALAARKRYTVHLTRSSDVYIPLDQRVEFSRDRGADLFISLHADSLGGTRLAKTVRGASIYTLSEKASNEEAQALADKENASDLVAGVQAADGVDDQHLKGILIDLMRRETAEFSTEFQKRLLPYMNRSIGLAPEPARSAAFRVLKQTEAPAVLIELGYMSNRQDARLLASREWQRKVAIAIAQAVDEFFARRTAKR